MKLIDRIKNKIKYEFLRMIKPEVISYPGSDAEDPLKKKRFSNFSHISKPENVTIGDSVFIGHFNYIDGFEKIEIGERCQITNFISILTHSSHNSIRLYGPKYVANWGTKMKGLQYGEVKIGAYTFIGSHCIILPGTVLGKGCLVSAYSLVKGEFPDYSVLRGIPAVVVGDTRKMDEKLLAEFPELEEMYYHNNLTSK